MLGILALALVLRLPELEDIPPDVHGDEASIGIEARVLLDGGWAEVFGVGWAGLPRLGYAFAAIPMRMFGNDLYGLRMASLIEGLLSVVLLYLVVRRLFGTRPALLAAFVLAVEPWHIHFSRTGFHYMQALPAVLLVVLFALRALDEKRALDFLLLGVALALCVTVYYAAREIALIVGPYILYRIARERVFIRRNLGELGWALIGFWVFLAPVLATLSHESRPLLGTRAGEDWLFSARNLEGNPVFVSYEVTSADLMRARGRQDFSS